MRQRGYGRDRELTVRMFVTGFLLFLLYLFFVGVLLTAGAGFIFIAIIAGALLVFQFFSSDKLVLWSMKAKIVSPQELPQIHGIVERLAQVVDIPKPKVALANTDIPNACATGRSPKKSVVCVTAGLMRLLSDAELEAVLAHELSHIKNRDVMMMTLAAFFATLAGMLAQWLSFSAMFGGMGRGGRQGGGMGALMMVMLVAIVVYFASQLLILALSRYREYAADRGGAIMVGAPATLASALMKISGDIQRIPDKDLRHVEGASAFFIIPALHGDSMARFFSSHPSLEKRVERLRRMQQEMERL